MDQTQLMNNQVDLGRNFLMSVLPKLDANEVEGLKQYTNQVGQVATTLAKATEEANKENTRKVQTAKRKQANVNFLYNGGMPAGGAQ